MLTKEDILAIAELMDEKLKPINEDLTGVKQDLSGVKQDLSRMDHRLAEVEIRLGEVGEVASGAKILIETEIDRAIKVLGEGHLGILDSMKALVTQKQLEEVSVRVFALEEGFKKHSQQIEELQQKTG